MKVLIISHNSFGYTSAMGKTLSKLFELFDENELAQLYVYNEKPKRSDICKNYYRFTDKDALYSIISNKRQGIAYDFINDNHFNSITISNQSSWMKQQLHKIVRRRKPYIYIMRDLVWKMGNCINSKTIKWAKDFNPDVIFLASGDYAFIYDIALELKRILKKPLVVMCFDDFYLFNTNNKSILGRKRYKKYMKLVHKTIESSSCIITVSEPMKNQYEKLFNKKCFVLYTASEEREICPSINPNRIAYFGGLGLKRHEQLVCLGKVLAEIDYKDKPKGIDVYTFDNNPDYRKNLTMENGIILHNGVSTDEMYKIYSECIALVHVESFNKEIYQRTKYSISTKIAESLTNAPCLLAYGPKGIASIDYLIDNNSAVVASSPNELKTSIIRLLEDKKYVLDIRKNARRIAHKNHNSVKNFRLLNRILQGAINNEY